MMNEYLEKYLEHRKYLFPCNQDKSPATRNGFHDATKIRAEIDAQFRGGNYLIGLPTGDINGIVVIDIDVNKPIHKNSDVIDPRNADELIEEIEERYGELPETLQVETPSGGRHLYYRIESTKLRSATRFFDKSLPVDIRANGGYVIAPDGISGYSFYDCDPFVNFHEGYYSLCMAPLPEWIEKHQKAHDDAAVQVAENVLPVEEIREIRSALAWIDSDDRDTWVRIGMALKSTGSQSARGLWDEWSQKSNKYDPIDQEKTWHSFRPSDLTIASLFHEAKAMGWVTTYGTAASQSMPAVEDDDEDDDDEFRSLYDELDEIKNFEIKTYKLGPTFQAWDVPEIAAIGDKFITIGGEKSSGKTSLATAIALEVLENHPEMCMRFYTIDDPKPISGKRLISQMLQRNVMGKKQFDTSDVDYMLDRIFTRAKCPKEKVMKKKKGRGSVPDVLSISEQIIKSAEKLKYLTDSEGIIIIIDYLQIIKSGADRQEINEITTELKNAQKALSKSGGCLMLLLSQLNRDRNSTGSRYRESSEIENVSDVCIDIRHKFIEMVNPQTGKKAYDADTENPIRYVSISKNKLAPAGQEYITQINPDFTFQTLSRIDTFADNFVAQQKLNDEPMKKKTGRKKHAWMG